MDNAAPTDGSVRRAPFSDRRAATFSRGHSADTPALREPPGSGDASSPVWRQSWSLPAWGTAGRIPPEGRSSVSIVRASNQPAFSKLPRAALLTIGLATLINLGLFFVFTAAGLITESVLIPSPSGARPLIAFDVVIATVLGMLVAVLVFAAIIRFRGARAERTWQVVAVIVLVLSFFAPITSIPGAPLRYALALLPMHIVAGVLAIWVLPALTRE